MNNKRRLTNKYILLAILLIAVFVLPSCRTRISNNSEITNVHYDEDGLLSESYQLRRDELDLSTAEKPLLPNFGSGETDDNDDFAEGESIDYNPEDYQEDFTEPDTSTSTNSNTNTSTNTSTNSGTRTPTRRTVTPSRKSSSGTTKKKKEKVTITFDGNGGKSKEGSRTLTKGSKIGKLPDVTAPDGKNFAGWYTDKSGGSAIKETDTVTRNVTVYAHWTDKPTYIVTFDARGGESSSSIKVVEGGKYTLPKQPKYTGYIFKGWYTEINGGGTKIENNAKFTANKDQTVYAFWEDAYDVWETKLKDESLTEKQYYLLSGDGYEYENCALKDTGNLEEAEYLMIVDNDISKDKVKEIIEAEPDPEILDKLKKKKVIAISNSIKDAEGSKWLIDRISLVKKVHGKLDPDQAKKDLGVGPDDIEVYDKLFS